MTLKEEAKAILKKLLGSIVSEQVDSFDDSEKYPNDFLDECTDFLGRFIGQDAAKKKFEPLYKKYVK